VSEQLGLEGALGERARVDGHHRLRRAAAQRVERARDDLLARPVLAGDEDVGVRGADVPDEFEHGLHRGRLRDEERALAAAAVLAQHLVLGLKAFALPERARQLRVRAQDGQEPRVVPRLLDEVARAALHRLDGQLDAAPRGHHDDWERRVELAHPREEV
jgi:hypothetical protein